MTTVYAVYAHHIFCDGIQNELVSLHMTEKGAEAKLDKLKEIYNGGDHYDPHGNPNYEWDTSRAAIVEFILET